MFENEPNVPSALLALDNVVLTPHVGSATWQTRQAMADLAFGNLQAHFAGKPLLVAGAMSAPTRAFDLSRPSSRSSPAAARASAWRSRAASPRPARASSSTAATATSSRPRRRRCAARACAAERRRRSTSPIPTRCAPASPRVAGALGAVDILVNNAGIQHRAPIAEFSDADWRRLMATNLDAPFYMARAVDPGDAGARRAGKIINIASLMSSLARPTTVPYQASKGGIAMLTRGLAVELAPHDIQVNAIAPGLLPHRDERRR